MEKQQNKQPKTQQKKNRQVKFEDVLATYKLIKDIYARIDDIERRLKLVEDYMLTKSPVSDAGNKDLNIRS